MKTSESGIEKIEGKRGTVFRVQIRKKGCKHQSRTFTNFKEAKKWKYETFSALAKGEITDTAKMRRTTLKHLIDRNWSAPKIPLSGGRKLSYTICKN